MSATEPLRPSSLLTRQLLAVGLAFAAVLGVLFWPTFLWMAERFDASDSFYSHGWLIPVASAWLVWQRRRIVAMRPIQPSFWGLALLVPAVAVHALTTWWRLGFLSGFAMLASVYGLVWTCWGWSVLWALRFPMLYLLFMVPLPGVLLIAASFHMKLAAATLATWILHLIGMPAVQAGSMIQVPGVSVIVDDTCSGLRSLISLIALATLWTSLMPASSKTWHRMVVLASAIPIALVANMVRILVLVFLSAIYGPKIADSFIHYGSGVVVFGIALALLIWLSRWVQRWSLFGLNRSPSSS